MDPNPSSAAASLRLQSPDDHHRRHYSPANPRTLFPHFNFKPLITKTTAADALSTAERAAIGACGGAIAGAFTHFFLFPLDTIKTKLQVKGASSIYSGALDVASKTFRDHGLVQGFYRGVSAVVVGSAASSAVYFGTCELGKSILSRIESFPRLLVPPAAGALANVVSSAIMVPKELITQRMQASAATCKTTSWEVLVGILQNDGFLGLYAGYSATLLRNLPAGVVNYSSFEYLKAAVLTGRGELEKGRVHLEPIESVVCGALAGAISASLTTPLDVVKTRMMTSSAAAAAGGVAEAVRRIVAEEGVVGFSRGMGPRVFHGALFSAIGFLAFETAKGEILKRYLTAKEIARESEVAVPA